MARSPALANAAGRESRRLRVLKRLAVELARSSGASELSRIACRFLAKEFGSFNIAVFLRDADAPHVMLENCAGAYSEFARPGKYRQRLGDGIIGRVARTGRRCVVQDVRRWPGFFQLRGMNIRSEMAVPIRGKGRTIGVLNVDSDRVNAFAPEDVAMFETAAGQLAVALERARLIAALEGELAERHRIEQSLRSTEAELRRVTGSISDYLWSIELDERGRDVRRYYSPVVKDVTGRPAEFFQTGRRQWLSIIHPDDRERLLELSNRIRAARLQKVETVYRIFRPDGTVRWLRDCVVIRHLSNGHRQFDGVVSDITERKEAEDALRGLPARILAAQEAERHRIAGELHDGVGQTLSAAKFRLHAAEAALPATLPGAPNLRRARELAALALRDVRRITRNLRPSELDDLGLLPALRALVDEFRDRTRLRVEFSVHGSLNDISANLSLAVFRVVQEGLANIEKHAAAGRVRLHLSRIERHLRLRLADDGRGFKMHRRNHHHGLGLVHMRERATALGGALTVESAPRRGTRVVANWPLPRE